MISIIVPIFNTSAYLEQCISSIINQTYKDFELILVDDGSTDNSLEICKSFSEEDSRIKVFHKPNSGVSATRNLGLEKATGDYISFCDSDDIISPSLYEILYNKLVEVNTDRIVAGYQFLYSSGRVLKCKGRRPDGLYYTKELIGEMIDDGTLSGFLFSGVCNSLFKKSIIDKYCIRFNENVKYNEDGLFSLEYAIHSKSMFSLQSLPLYSYRKHSSSASAKKKEGDIFKPLKDYLINNMNDIADLNLDIQLKRRIVTETLWKVLEIARFEKGKKAVLNISNEIKKNNIKSKCMYLRQDRMNRYKKMYLFLMKHNLAIFLYLLSRFIFPFASKYISR